MSSIPTYVCIILTSPFNCVFFYFLICMVITAHLSWKKVSVYWSMSLVNSLLGGKENLIITVALCLLGHHISQRLHMCWGMESQLKHLCLLGNLLSWFETFPCMFSISSRRFGVIGCFLCVYLNFVAGLNIGGQDDVNFSFSSALHCWHLVTFVSFNGNSCVYQLT